MRIKNISRFFCFILAAVMLFSLIGCGNKKDDDNSDKASKEKEEFSLFNETAVIDPSMEEYDHDEYVIEFNDELSTVTVYHKGDVIYGIDLLSVDPCGDRTDDDIDTALASVNDMYAAISEEDFAECQAFYSEESDSLVLNFHARNLDNKENLQMVADLGIFGALSSDSTYTELDETLLAMKFEKQ